MYARQGDLFLKLLSACAKIKIDPVLEVLSFMEMKIMLTGAIFLGGWLWSYLFIRQLLFNFATAFPLIKKMNSLQEDLIAIGAHRYTVISVITCSIVAAALLAAVIIWCPLYLQIGFAAGALLAIVLLIPRVSARNREMFDTFCANYYRFVPDDELRTAMYNKKTGQMKSRLKAMGIQDTFIPAFKETK